MNRLLWMALLPALLTGCSNNLIRDRSQDYQGAAVLPPIEIPGDLKPRALEPLLVVPDIGDAAVRSEGAYEVPRPEVFYAESGNETVNLDRTAGGKRILVEEPVKHVWREIKAFLAYNEIKVASSSEQPAFFETDWIRQDAESPGFFERLVDKLSDQEGEHQDKLRISLSAEPATTSIGERTAISLRHVRQPVGSDITPDWAKDSEDVSYKSEVMYELLHYLSKATEHSTARALAARERDPNRAFLGRDSKGQPVLKLTADIDNAWAQVGDALQRAKLDVGSSSPELGKFYMTFSTETPFIPPEKPGGISGFLSWLHGDRDDITLDTGAVARVLGVEEDAKAQTVYSAQPVQPKTEQELLQEQEGYKIWLAGKVIYVFDKNPSAIRKQQEGDVIRYSGRFQVLLSRRNSGVYVSVLDDLARPAPAPVAEEILWQIKQHLSAG